MDVLLVSGIWPPEVGGPATHAPKFGRFLIERGHRVRAATTIGAAPPVDPGFPVVAARKDRSRLVRQPAAAMTVIAAAHHSEVIYATGMYGRSAAAAAVHRLPLVLKLVSDPAYERARRLGFFSGTLEEFQGPHRHPAVRSLKRLRNLTLSRASSIVIPSRYLAEIAGSWGTLTDRIRVIPNPAPAVAELAQTPRAELRKRLGMRFPAFVFAGRLTPQKNLPLALEALRQVPDASLVVIGDGPSRQQLSRLIDEAGLGSRVAVKGALPRAEAIEWMRAADACLLPSDWENFPHAAVEALAVGTPILASSVGGVPEIVEPGVNGILIEPGDVAALAESIASIAQDRALLASLREGALTSSHRYRQDVVYDAIAQEVERAVAAG